MTCHATRASNKVGWPAGLLPGHLSAAVPACLPFCSIAWQQVINTLYPSQARAGEESSDQRAAATSPLLRLLAAGCWMVRCGAVQLRRAIKPSMHSSALRFFAFGR